MVYNGKPYWNGWFGRSIIFGNIHIGDVLVGGKFSVGCFVGTGCKWIISPRKTSRWFTSHKWREWTNLQQLLTIASMDTLSPSTQAQMFLVILPRKLAAIAPERWCLEDDPFLLKWSLFRGHIITFAVVQPTKNNKAGATETNSNVKTMLFFLGFGLFLVANVGFRGGYLPESCKPINYHTHPMNDNFVAIPTVLPWVIYLSVASFRKKIAGFWRLVMLQKGCAETYFFAAMVRTCPTNRGTS